MGASADAVAMGGASSWTTFAKFVGIDVMLNAGMEHLNRKGSNREVSVEDCISKGCLGNGQQCLFRFPEEAQGIRKHENSYIKTTNALLKNKIPTPKLYAYGLDETA